MGSIPVRSTKKRRMQFCIRRFLVFFLVNRPSVRQYGLPYSCRGTPACGKRQIPVSNISKSKSLQFCIRRFLVFFLVNRPRFVNMACHILAEGLPLAGNGKFPHISTKTIIAILHSAFFGILSRESPLGSSIWLAKFLPRDSRLRETANSRRIKVAAALFFNPSRKSSFRFKNLDRFF